MSALLTPTVHTGGGVAPLVPSLRRALLVAAIALPLAALAVGLRVVDPAGRRFVILYVTPLLLIVPLWLKLRLDHLQDSFPVVRILDIAIVAFSAARLAGDIAPVSGHMLFLTYTVLTTPTRWYRWVAGALILETSIFKLWIWRDVNTWAWGLVVGAAAALAYRLCIVWASPLTRACC